MLSMHKRYLHGGPVDAKGTIYARYNCVSDDKKIIQLHAIRRSHVGCVAQW